MARGIYADGVMFGIVDEGIIYLKADEATAPAFRREACRLYDDRDELAQWARVALGVAQRGADAKAVEVCDGSRRAPG